MVLGYILTFFKGIVSTFCNPIFSTQVINCSGLTLVSRTIIVDNCYCGYSYGQGSQRGLHIR